MNYQYTVSQKIIHSSSVVSSCPYLCQTLMDFQNSFEDFTTHYTYHYITLRNTSIKNCIDGKHKKVE